MESARISMKGIPEIRKKIQETEGIVATLETSLENKTKVANEAKEKCLNAKEQMDRLTEEKTDIKTRTKQLEKDFESILEELSVVTKQEMENTKEIERLEKLAAEEELVIGLAKIKIDQTKVELLNAEMKLEKTMKTLQLLIEEMEQMEDIDSSILDAFGWFAAWTLNVH
jgi:chromosome segregation ATPase